MSQKELEKASLYSLQELVEEIMAINQAWKLACDLDWENNLSGIAQSLGKLKTRLQVRLLRKYAPDRLYLEVDRDNKGLDGEDLYGLILREPFNNYWNAAHLPVRLAESIFSCEEIEYFSKV